MSKLKLNIDTGFRIGRICIGDLVRFVQNHPLFAETPQGYLQQGRLRECLCDCGNVKLIAESVLATGRVKSCGCLRQEIRAKAAKEKISRLQLKANKNNLTDQIQIEQARLKALKLDPIHVRNEKAITETATRIRSMLTKRGILIRELKQTTVKES